MMRTTELAQHLDVSFRQLDYFVGRPDSPITHADLGVTPGPGSRRLWPPWIIGRLEVATKLAKLIDDAAGCAAWPTMADKVLRWEGDVPQNGWVLVDDLGDVHIAETLAEVSVQLRKSSGGLLVCYALTFDPAA